MQKNEITSPESSFTVALLEIWLGVCILTVVYLGLGGKSCVGAILFFPPSLL